MLLHVEKLDGSSHDVAIDTGLRVIVDGFVEPLPVTRLTALELQQSDVVPILTATFGAFTARPYSLWPNSVLEAGAERFTISELESVTLENGAHGE